MPLTFKSLLQMAAQFNGVYSWGFLGIFAALVFSAYFAYCRPNPLFEKWGFLLAGALLVIFTAIHPIGLSRDGQSYIGISSGICPLLTCTDLAPYSRDWGWHYLVSLLKHFFSSERAPLILSAIGTLVQLWVIYKLCRHKLLALTLFIPLTYLYYDFTLLRAGIALTLFFIGLYLLARSRPILGMLALLSNYGFHSQGIFSIGVIPFGWIAKYKPIAITIILGLVACIYLQWVPPTDHLSFLAKTESESYWNQYVTGVFAKENIFPIANLIILAYLILILVFNKESFKQGSIEQYALGSILLGAFLAWVFAPIHAIQTRLFDFYLAPLVFVAGNLRLNKVTLIATLGLATALYLRMELLHNWILG